MCNILHFPSPCMQLPPSNIVPGSSLPHPIVRSAIGTLDIVDQVLDKVHLIHSENNLYVKCIILYRRTKVKVPSAVCNITAPFPDWPDNSTLVGHAIKKR